MTITVRRAGLAALAGTTLAAGLLAATIAGPASAAPAPRTVAPASHCVSASVPVGAAVNVAPARCFTSFTDALSHATQGAVRLPAGATTVTQSQLDSGRARLMYQQPALVATVVLGVSYKDTGQSGDTWIHTGTYGCDTNPDVDWQNTGPLVGPGGGWDNAIGSAVSFSDCTGRYWANSGFWGANIDTPWGSGVMNNASSSIQWY